MRVAIISALLFLAGFTAPLRAQVKLPIFDESDNKVQNVTFHDATEAGDYKHGKLLRITLNSDPHDTIKGTLVRTDPTKKILYVRTQPGSPPRAIAVGDIKRVEKGTIQQASYRSEATAPEIHELAIYNGGIKTVAYRAPDLSPQEVAVLDRMESAQNELARQKRLARMQESVLANELALQTADRETREIVNRLLEQRLAYYGLERPLLDRTGRALALANAAPFGGDPWAPELIITQTSPAQVINFGPAVTPKIPTTVDAVAQARSAWLGFQSRAVYENGQLVAVIVPEAVERPTSAKP